MYNLFMDILKRLEKEADKNYQKFSSSLLPNINNVLGVRLPILRKLAKEVVKENKFKSFLSEKKHKYMEEYMLKGMLIGLLKEPVEVIINYIKLFVPQIDNWAVCDSFCNSLKFTKYNLKEVWDFLQQYFESSSEYEIRFAYVMLLNYYLSDEYIDKVFCLVDKFKDDRYYAQMSVAWLVSICYIKYPSKTEQYLKKSKLDNWTYNKSIQKICESLKIDKETKIKLRKMKR